MQAHANVSNAVHICTSVLNDLLFLLFSHTIIMIITRQKHNRNQIAWIWQKKKYTGAPIIKVYHNFTTSDTCYLLDLTMQTVDCIHNTITKNVRQ